MFDPYRDWLGITDERRPPTLYQVLGLRAGEADANIIESAVARQLAKVHSHIAGSHSKEAWRIIDEITLAKNTLLDPAKRAAYDSIFGLGSKRPSPPVKPAPVPVPPVQSEWDDAEELPTAPLPPSYAPAPIVTPLPPQAPAPKPYFEPMPASKPVPSGNFLEDDDDHHHHDGESSSQGLPTPPSMRKSRQKSGVSPMVMIVGGILILGVAGGIFWFVTKDRKSDDGKNQVVDGGDKKGSPQVNPVETNPKGTEKKDPPKKKEPPKKIVVKPPDPPPPLEIASEFKESKLLRGHQATPRAVAVSPDGKQLLTAGDDNAVLSWTPSTDKASVRMNLKSPAIGAAFMPSGKAALVADGGKVHLLDLATNKELKSWSTTAGGFAALALAADGKHFITAMTNGKLFWFDASKGMTEPEQVMDAAERDVDCVTLASDSNTALAGARDGTASIWDAATGKQHKKWKAHPGGVSAVAFSPDGKTVATAGVDKLVILWDRQTGNKLLTLSGHTGVPLGVAWSSDGAMILTGGTDKSIRAWDAITGSPLRWLQTAPDKIESLALDPKDRYLIAGLGDSGVQLLFLPAVRPDYPPKSFWVKRPVPPQPRPLAIGIDAGVKTVREKYKDDYARTSTDDQLALYDKLIARADVAPEDPPTRYAYFQEARDLAGKMGRLDEAFKAVEACAQWFEVDELAEKAAVLKLSGKEMVGRSVVEAAVKVVEQAEKLARPDIVDELLRQRELFPQIPDAAELNAKFLAADKRWMSVTADRETGKKLAADYEKDPENAAANLALGKHLCFRLGDWTAGLPRLLKGDDAPLKDMAKKDQAAPKDGKSQLDLAKAWADFAGKADESVKPGALLRAKSWYDLASKASDLPAGERNSANARIIDINKLLDALPNTPGNKAALQVKWFHFNALRSLVAVDTQWVNIGCEGYAPEGILIKGDGSLTSRFRVLDPCRVECGFIPDGREVTVQLNGESAAFKPAASASPSYIMAERNGAQIRFVLKNFTGNQEAEKTATLAAGKLEASPISFKVAGKAEKDGLLIKSIVISGSVRPLD